MIAIVFANELDAKPFLKLYQRGRFEGVHEGDIVQDNLITLTVTGPGKIKSTLQTERLLHTQSFSRIIHPGTCSALNPKIEPGEILGISQVYEGDRIELTTPTYPRMPLDVPFELVSQATLVTQDHPLNEESEQTYWQRIADLSDNTSYAVAYVAATRGTPCHIIKIVTEQLSIQSDKPQQPIQEEVTKLAEYLIPLL